MWQNREDPQQYTSVGSSGSMLTGRIQTTCRLGQKKRKMIIPQTSNLSQLQIKNPKACANKFHWHERAEHKGRVQKYVGIEAIFWVSELQNGWTPKRLIMSHLCAWKPSIWKMRFSRTSYSCEVNKTNWKLTDSLCPKIFLSKLQFHKVLLYPPIVWCYFSQIFQLYLPSMHLDVFSGTLNVRDTQTCSHPLNHFNHRGSGCRQHSMWGLHTRTPTLLINSFESPGCARPLTTWIKFCSFWSSTWMK